MENKTLEQRENVIAGIAGAFLFSLAGAVVYFLLYLLGVIAALSGLVGVVCAIKGYSIFAKKESTKGVIIASVIAFLVIVLAWFFCLSYDIYADYKSAFEAGEIDFMLTFSESVRLAPEILEIPEFAKAYFGDLAIGLLFCLIGSGSYIVAKIKNAKKQPVNTPVVQAAPFMPEAVEENTEEAHSEDNAAE